MKGEPAVLQLMRRPRRENPTGRPDTIEEIAREVNKAEDQPMMGVVDLFAGSERYVVVHVIEQVLQFRLAGGSCRPGARPFGQRCRRLIPSRNSSERLPVRPQPVQYQGLLSHNPGPCGFERTLPEVSALFDKLPQHLLVMSQQLGKM